MTEQGILPLLVSFPSDPQISGNQRKLRGLGTDKVGAVADQPGAQTFGLAFDLGQRLRLCLRPRPTIRAAIRIGAPIPSTTGTPSSLLSQSGLRWTGHWVMPCTKMTSAPSWSISERAAATKFPIISSLLAPISFNLNPEARRPAIHGSMP